MNFSTQKVLTILTLSVFTVMGHWNFWTHGVYALGFNTTAFWLVLGGLLWTNNPTLRWKKDWVWVTPLLLMTLSFSLFENPWLKVISCVVLPASTCIFYAYSQLINNQQRFWGLQILPQLVKRSLTPLRHIVTAISYCQKLVANIFGKQDNDLSKRVFKGIILLIPLAILVLVLLSSADDNFGRLVDATFFNLLGALNLSIIAKVFCIFIMCILLFASLNAWKDPFDYTERKIVIALDDVVVGIVMGGILLIYLLFLWLQLDYLLIDSLPQNFSQTEQIVKSGFWQLFFLSILNTGLFFAVYKNTGTAAQIILRIFIIASGLLLLSAAWRMVMYVYWYGFSYEKFFASYTTLFALVVFIYLLLASFFKERKDVFRFIAFAALWSYGVATVMPVERIIFNSNVKLSTLSDSRIDLNDLKELSVDILNGARDSFAKKPTASKPSKTEIREWKRWMQWVRRQERKHCKRPWYENNLSQQVQCL